MVKLTVQNHNTPFLILKPFHRLLGFPRTFLSMSDHRICGYQYSATHRFVLRFAGKSTNHGIVGSGPHFKLLLPLFHRYTGVAKYQGAFTYGATGRYTD